MNVNNLTDHQEDNVQEYNNEKDFLTESYQISDLFSWEDIRLSQNSELWYL